MHRSSLPFSSLSFTPRRHWGYIVDTLVTGLGKGASRQDHSSLASLSLFHTSEMPQHFTNGIHLLIHTALGQQKDKIQKDKNRKRLKKGQKREAKRKKTEHIQRRTPAAAVHEIGQTGAQMNWLQDDTLCIPW